MGSTLIVVIHTGNSRADPLMVSASFNLIPVGGAGPVDCASGAVRYSLVDAQASAPSTLSQFAAQAAFQSVLAGMQASVSAGEVDLTTEGQSKPRKVIWSNKVVLVGAAENGNTFSRTWRSAPFDTVLFLQVGIAVPDYKEKSSIWRSALRTQWT